MFASLINNQNFWASLKKVEEILRPTSKVVGILESNNCCLSDIYSIFKGLLLEYRADNEILELVKDRWAFLHTASMGFAYFLDPKSRAGEGFVDDDLFDNAILLKEFARIKGFCDTDAEIQREYDNFIYDMKNPSEKATIFIRNNSARTYWLQVGSNKYPILGKVADIVLNIPTSQAAAERAWSIYDFILTKRRNRLNPEKVTKLVQLYMNAGSLEDEYPLIDIMMGLQVDDCDSESEYEE